LLLGADAFGGLPDWHRWRELFALAHIGVLTRPGRDADALPTELHTEIAARLCATPALLRASAVGRVLSIPVTSLEISASRIRDLLATGREPRWLVPDALCADPALLAPYR
jgi:nicotinate-nucleotide adenylyltransferase